MRRITISALALAFVGSAFAQFLPGNLAVLRIGDGSAPLANTGHQVFIDQFTVAGGPAVNSLATGTFLGGTATSEGFLARSGDGRFLTFGSYQNLPASGAINSTTSAASPRVFNLVNSLGSVNSTTALNDAFSAGNIRSTYTVDGTTIYGTGSTTGLLMANVGQTSGATNIYNTITNLRVVKAFNGNLYFSTGVTTGPGIYKVGSGLPTTTGQTASILASASGGSPSPYDFYFADANTLYVADDRTGTNGGGIMKFVNSGPGFALQYTLSENATTGNRGLTGVTVGGVTTLYATTQDGQRVVSVVDNGVGSTFTTLATAGTNTLFRGIALTPQAVPEPATMAILGIGALAAIRRRRSSK